MTPPDRMSSPPEGGWESLKVDELTDDDVAQKDNVGAPEAATAEVSEQDESAEAPASAPASRRRGSAETSTSTSRRAAPTLPEGDLVVRARSKYVRSAPRKARLVMAHIRGKEVEDARA